MYTTNEPQVDAKRPGKQFLAGRSFLFNLSNNRNEYGTNIVNDVNIRTRGIEFSFLVVRARFQHPYECPLENV